MVSATHPNFLPAKKALQRYIKFLIIKNKKIFISNLQQKVKEVYELLGFSNFFDIIDNLNEISVERKHLFPVSLKCPQCSVSLKAPRPGRFSCKLCKHIFIIDELGKLEIDRSQ